jgi:membrane protease YdiL (CAAX protease family)
MRMALEFLADSNVPPWLPCGVGEARRLAFAGQYACFFLSLIFAALGGLLIMFGHFSLGMVLIGVCLLGLGITYMLKDTFFDIIDAGDTRKAEPRLLLWAILGLFIGLIPGALLLFAFVRLQEAMQHEAHLKAAQ